MRQVITYSIEAFSPASPGLLTLTLRKSSELTMDDETDFSILGYYTGHMTDFLFKYKDKEFDYVLPDDLTIEVPLSVDDVERMHSYVDILRGEDLDGFMYFAAYRTENRSYS